ncbi:hypothetical protein [Streptomyces roseolus]|uniref:hypothetical protein n=1 Tax=Streptomyces roseolus TaxID=67358 RepID=UPI00364AD1F9
MTVLAAGRATTVKAGGEATAAFRHDLAAPAQFTAREGTGTIPARGRTEPFLTGGEQHEHKLGIMYGGRAPASARFHTAGAACHAPRRAVRTTDPAREQEPQDGAVGSLEPERAGRALTPSSWTREQTSSAGGPRREGTAGRAATAQAGVRGSRGEWLSPR